MRYVVFLIDPDSGSPVYGDIQTDKSHAQRWANSYIKEGYAAGVAPATLVNERK